MSDTIDKRVADIEQVLAHLPEDLDARFAGVDTKLAQIREVLALHSTPSAHWSASSTRSSAGWRSPMAGDHYQTLRSVSGSKL